MSKDTDLKPETDAAEVVTEEVKEAADEADTKVAKKPAKKTKAGPKSHAADAIKKEKVSKKPNPPRDPRGKKLRAAAALVEEGKEYTLEEAAALIAKTSVTKFDASVELHVRVSQEARGMITFPKPTGKPIRVAVVTPELLEDLSKGKVNFDVLLATPAQMPQLGKFARSLGPKGLMPNPKSGTVTNDIDKAKAEFEAGRVEYRTDEGKNVHIVVAKVSSKPEVMIENATTVLASLGAFGIRHIALATTMGPSIPVAVLTE